MREVAANGRIKLQQHYLSNSCFDGADRSETKGWENVGNNKEVVLAESAKTAFLFASERIGVRQRRPFDAAKMDSVGIYLRNNFAFSC